MARYKITVSTECSGDSKWLEDYLKVLRYNYGGFFTEDLTTKGRAELNSRDPDGAVAVSVYELTEVN